VVLLLVVVVVLLLLLLVVVVVLELLLLLQRLLLQLTPSTLPRFLHADYLKDDSCKDSTLKQTLDDPKVAWQQYAI